MAAQLVDPLEARDGPEPGRHRIVRLIFLLVGMDRDERFLGRILGRRRRKPLMEIAGKPLPDLGHQPLIGLVVPRLGGGHEAVPAIVEGLGRMGPGKVVRLGFQGGRCPPRTGSLGGFAPGPAIAARSQFERRGLAPVLPGAHRWPPLVKPICDT